MPKVETVANFSPEMSGDFSHLECDSLTGDLVIIAPGRRYRPDATSAKTKKVMNPFAPQNLKSEKILAVYGRGKFKCTAIENAYPVFHRDRELRGYQEVLVEGAAERPFAEFTAPQMATVLQAMAERCRILRRMPKLKYLVVFKNEGREAGASQPHPHSQIFGVSFVPKRLKVLQAKRHKLKSAQAAILEMASKERTIYSDKNVVAFADPASRFAYGVRLVPRRKIDNITRAEPAELISLAKALFALMPLIRQRGLAYNLFFHDVFADTQEVFEIRFAPRANTWAGFELDSGIVVNPVPAEFAAREYREARKRS